MGLVKKSSSAAVLISIIMIAMTSLSAISMSAEYKLDLDSTGWTIMDDNDDDDYDYDFDFSMPIKLGDSVVITYDNKTHNLLEVRIGDYESCNSLSPIVKYTSGRDNITFNREGDYYFICGFPNHCTGGERMIFTSVPEPYRTYPPIMTPKSFNPETSSPSASSSGRKIGQQNKP